MVVDFDKVELFPDTDVASMCTVVCGSNGERGSFSHLTITQDPQEYAKSLLRLWSRPVPIIMYGGDASIRDSVVFFDALRDELESLGFSIRDLDRGGVSLYRHGTLLPDKIELQVRDYAETIRDRKLLHF